MGVVDQGGVRQEDGSWVKGNGGHKHGFDLLEELKSSDTLTVPDIFEFAATKHGTAPCMGTRELLERHKIPENGKTLEKLRLGEYTYRSYVDVLEHIKKFSNGLRNLGLGSGDRVAMFAETRCEWFMAAVGCLRNNSSVVTLYTNLPNDSIAESLKETEIHTAITSHDLLGRFFKIAPQCPLLRRVIVIEDQLEGVGSTLEAPSSIQVIGFKDVLTEEASDEAKPHDPPKPDDVAIIMYTSGSTSKPKGVELSHRNIFSAITAYCIQADLGLGDTYMAYLPLAHVMELATEIALTAMNVTIAYSTPFTLTNNSAKIMKGTQGDARVARPTCMSAVPIILERIIKGVTQAIENQGSFKSRIFREALKIKQRQDSLSFAGKVLDMLIFNRVKEELGGHLRMLVVGGAPVSPETHDKIRAMFGCTVQVGYGATETSACICSMDTHDTRTGHCGPPNHGVTLRLEDWPEGEYLTTDKPNPRGEIVVGGPMVSRGYFNNTEKTSEVFFDEGDKRWFKTGDIGEMDETGVLRVIDRKVDLIKLSHGEYVSLGNIESKLKTHSLVEGICVCVNPGAKSVVGIVVPHPEHTKKIAIKLGHTEDATITTICEDQAVADAFLEELKAHGKKQGLGRWDIPAAIFLTPEPWTPESGLVTAALKVKRSSIKAHFKKDIDAMYRRLEEKDQLSS